MPHSLIDKVGHSKYIISYNIYTNKQVSMPHSLLHRWGIVSILYRIIFNTNKQVSMPHSVKLIPIYQGD